MPPPWARSQNIHLETGLGGTGMPGIFAINYVRLSFVSRKFMAGRSGDGKSAFAREEFIFDAVRQRLPTGLHDIFRNPHRAPDLLMITRFEQHPYLCSSPLAGGQHPYLVVQ